MVMATVKTTTNVMTAIIADKTKEFFVLLPLRRICLLYTQVAKPADTNKAINTLDMS